AARGGAEAGPRRAPGRPPGRRGHPRGSQVPRPQSAGVMTPLPPDQVIAETTMNGTRENRSSGPAGSQAGRKTPETDARDPERGGARQTLIRVQCPNPACGQTYTVRSSCAGQNGRCKCGAVFPIPNVSTPLSGGLTSPAPGQLRGEGAHRAAGEGL